MAERWGVIVRRRVNNLGNSGLRDFPWHWTLYQYTGKSMELRRSLGEWAYRQLTKVKIGSQVTILDARKQKAPSSVGLFVCRGENGDSLLLAPPDKPLPGSIQLLAHPQPTMYAKTSLLGEPTFSSPDD